MFPLLPKKIQYVSDSLIVSQAGLLLFAFHDSGVWLVSLDLSTTINWLWRHFRFLPRRRMYMACLLGQLTHLDSETRFELPTLFAMSRLVLIDDLLQRRFVALRISWSEWGRTSRRIQNYRWQVKPLLHFQRSFLVSPRQTSIYVMCPWDHDIWSLLFTTPSEPCQKVVM